MPVDVTSEIVIHRPRAAVADYVLDPTHLHEWRTDVVDVRREHSGPVAVGSRYLVRSKGRRREVERIDQVVALDELSSITVRTVLGETPLEVELSLTPEHRNSTRVAVRTTGASGRLGPLGDPLLRRAVIRNTGSDLARLKTILELARGQ